jgi:hypothetical protein
MSRAAGFVFAAFALATLGGLVAAGRLVRAPNAVESASTAARGLAERRRAPRRRAGDAAPPRT